MTAVCDLLDTGYVSNLSLLSQQYNTLYSTKKTAQSVAGVEPVTLPSRSAFARRDHGDGVSNGASQPIHTRTTVCDDQLIVMSFKFDLAGNRVHDPTDKRGL